MSNNYIFACASQIKCCCIQFWPNFTFIFSEIYCDKIDIDFDYFTNLILPCLFLGLAAFGIFGNLIIIILLLIQKLKKAVDVLVLNLGFG